MEWYLVEMKEGTSALKIQEMGQRQIAGEEEAFPFPRNVAQHTSLHENTK